MEGRVVCNTISLFVIALMATLGYIARIKVNLGGFEKLTYRVMIIFAWQQKANFRCLNLTIVHSGDSCTNFHCQHGGSCRVQNSKATCHCASSYYGEH